MMFTNLSFDELNELVTNERSMSFKKYFGEMNLPEEEKSKRIQMAEELEENFIVTMTLGSIPSYAYENFCEMYNAYHKLGGNGMITKMMHEIEELHLREKGE